MNKPRGQFSRGNLGGTGISGKDLGKNTGVAKTQKGGPRGKMRHTVDEKVQWGCKEQSPTQNICDK